MKPPVNTGTRVGDKFLWIDIDRLQLRENDKAVLLTARKAFCNGDIITREIATWEHVHSLRRIASEIEKALQETTSVSIEEKAA